MLLWVWPIKSLRGNMYEDDVHSSSICCARLLYTCLCIWSAHTLRRRSALCLVWEHLHAELYKHNITTHTSQGDSSVQGSLHITCLKSLAIRLKVIIQFIPLLWSQCLNPWQHWLWFKRNDSSRHLTVSVSTHKHWLRYTVSLIPLHNPSLSYHMVFNMLASYQVDCRRATLTADTQVKVTI